MHGSVGTFIPAMDLQDRIENAIMSMPSYKAARLDLVIAEATKTAPKRQAEFLANLCRAVGRIGLVPTQWNNCTIVPLYKKGDATKPSHHCPIVLVSHSRKVIEKVLDNALRAGYEFHPAQLEFCRNRGTEIAILQAIPPLTLHDDNIAILDLKQAYSSVAKKKLLELCREELTPKLCHQLQHILKPTSFETVRDDSKAVGTFNMRLPQGSDASPSLYNVFMDSFPRSVIAEEPRSTNPVIMFADDIQLRARSKDSLRALLKQAVTWAVANDMTWNVATCLIICADPNEGDPFTLAGEVVREVTHAEYLGLTMTVKRIIATVGRL